MSPNDLLVAAPLNNDSGGGGGGDSVCDGSACGDAVTNNESVTDKLVVMVDNSD